MKLVLLSIFIIPLFASDYMYQEGKNIYNTTCISCHGENGETNPDMKLIIQPRKLQKTILSKEQSFKIIKHGAHYWGARADIMPAFKYVYSDEQIRSVAYYISQAFNNEREKRVQQLLKKSEKIQKSELSLSVGETIWTKKCSKCHGISGNGESEYAEKSKENDEFIYPYNLTRTLLNEDQIFLYAKYGGHFWGTSKSDMPSWKKKFDDKELRSVAHFVKMKITKIK